MFRLRSISSLETLFASDSSFHHLATSILQILLAPLHPVSGRPQSPSHNSLNSFIFISQHTQNPRLSILNRQVYLLYHLHLNAYLTISTACRPIARAQTYSFILLFVELGNMEPCTAWLFNMVDGNPSTVTQRNDPKKLESTFAAYWRSPGRTHGMSPVELMSGTHIRIRLHMKKVENQKHWTYDYNVSIHPHAIEVITYLKDYQTPNNNHSPTLKCVGNQGHIDRHVWQFASLIDHRGKTTAGTGAWMSVITELDIKLGEILKKVEERMKLEANLVTEPPRAHSIERAAPSESGSNDKDENRSSTRDL